MDRKLKKSRSVLKPCGVNRLSSLPDELVSKIVSMLPFKDVAAMQVLCKTMRRDAFTWITSVDLDDSPVSYCQKSPQLPHRFPLFVIFVDHILNKLSLLGLPLTRFRFHVGGDKTTHCRASAIHECDEVCSPRLEPSRLNAWISYPLALLGLRELDLSFYLRNPSDHHLPPQLFASQSLVVLKLDSNVNLDAADFSDISLPKLEVLHLYSLFIVQDDFITKLVSCCPSLEDLEIAFCRWNQADRVAISSHSLRRIVLHIFKRDEDKNSGVVLIDTPNLQYFDYDDNLAYRYSITNMKALVQAKLAFGVSLLNEASEISVQVQISLVRMLSNIHHLSLLDSFVETMYYRGDYEDQLPVLHNLKTLELGWNSNGARWDKVLLEILTSSPSLETLVFPQGLYDFSDPWHDTTNPELLELADLEDQVWKTTNVTPQCLQSHLKQIVIKKYVGIARELNIIKFLLRKASVLRELVVCLSPKVFGLPRDDHMLFESTLKELPRASLTCSIRVLQPSFYIETGKVKNRCNLFFYFFDEKKKNYLWLAAGVWTPNPAGYSVASAYDWYRKKLPLVAWQQYVWNVWCVPKHNFINWLIIRNALPLKDKLFKLGICSDDLCLLCGRDCETHAHVFQHCPYTKILIGILSTKLSLKIPAVNTLAWIHAKPWSKGKKQVANAYVEALYYSVWLQRNRARTEGSIYLS